MKKIIIIILFLPTIIIAKSWKVERVNDYYMLKHQSLKKHSYQIFHESGLPKFRNEKKINSSFTLIIYEAGSSGTSMPVTTVRAIILDSKTMSYIGDAPYAYESKGSYEIVQPKWNITNKQIIVNDEEEGSKKAFKSSK